MLAFMIGSVLSFSNLVYYSLVPHDLCVFTKDLHITPSSANDGLFDDRAILDMPHEISQAFLVPLGSISVLDGSAVMLKLYHTIFELGMTEWIVHPYCWWWWNRLQYSFRPVSYGLSRTNTVIVCYLIAACFVTCEDVLYCPIARSRARTIATYEII